MRLREDAMMTSQSLDGSRAMDRTATGKMARTIVSGVLARFGTRITHRIGMHSHQYHGVAISSDASRIATANRDGTARLWDAGSGQCLMVFRGHSDELRRAVFTHDDKTLITTANDGTLRLWECTTGRCLSVLAGHKGDVLAVALSPDGRRIASAGDDGTIRVWSFASGTCECRVDSGDRGISRVLITTDGTALVAQDFSGRLSRRDFPDLGNPSFMEDAGYPGPSKDFALTRDGKVVSAAINDILVFDVYSGELERVYPLDPRIVYKIIAMPGKPRFAAVCFPNTTIFVMDAETGTVEKEFRGHGDDVTGMALSSDGKILATASLDSTARIWDIDKGECLRIIGTAENVKRLCLSDDGTSLTGIDGNGLAKTWDLVDGRQRNISRNAWSVAPVSRGIATGHRDGRICIWVHRTCTDEPLVSLKAHESGLPVLASCLPGTYLVSGSHDGDVKLWDMETFQCVATFSLPGLITILAVDDTARWIAAGRYLDSRLVIFDLQSGQRFMALDDPAAGSSRIVRGLSFLPGTRGLAAPYSDGRVIIWDPLTCRPLRVIAEPDCTIFCMTLQRKGWRAAVGTVNAGIWLWDLERGICQVLCPYDGRAVLSIALTSDDRRLLAGYDDGTVSIIDISNGHRLCSMLNVDEGSLWFSEPDAAARDGWIWTDRDDLVHVLEEDFSGRVVGAVRSGDPRRAVYLRTRNNPPMIKSLLKGTRTYEQSAGRYLQTLNGRRNTDDGSLGLMLPKGTGHE